MTKQATIAVKKAWIHCCCGASFEVTTKYEGVTCDSCGQSWHVSTIRDTENWGKLTLSAKDSELVPAMESVACDMCGIPGEYDQHWAEWIPKGWVLVDLGRS